MRSSSFGISAFSSESGRFVVPVMRANDVGVGYSLVWLRRDQPEMPEAPKINAWAMIGGL